MKKENKTLLSFLCGIFAVSTAIPILEELTNLILTWIEYLKIVPSKKLQLEIKIYRILSEIQKNIMKNLMQLDLKFQIKVKKMTIIMMNNFLINFFKK